MTTNYHTPIPSTGVAANASTVNDPLGDLDAGIGVAYARGDDALSLAVANNTEIVAARDVYVSLDARFDNISVAGSNVSTNANGAASAAQKVITVNSTTGFLENAPIAYTLVSGVSETNVVDTVDSPTQLTCTTNIGATGIPDNGYIVVINPGTLVASGAVTGATAQEQVFTNGIITGLLKYTDATSQTFKLNANGFAFGDHTPTGTDDFVRVTNHWNGNTSVIVENTNAGADAQTVLHMWSDLAGIRIATYSTAGGGYVNLISHDDTEFNIMQAANVPLNFWTNNVRRASITGAGNMTLGADTSLNGLRDFTVQNDNAGASAEAQLSIVTNGPVFRMKAYSTAGGGYVNIGLTGSTNGLNFVVGDNAPLAFYTNNLQRMTILGSGDTGIGNTNPSSLLHVTKASTNTNSIQQLLTLGVNSTGTAAAGLGSRVQWELESTTTDNTIAALMDVTWVTATHASRAARAQLWVYDTSGRECIRMEASGTAPMLGFYGVNATARQVLATGAGATVDNVITALQTLGLLAQS